MAEEKDQEDRTEEPTQRKLDQAQEKGDVAKSIELNTFFILGGFTIAMLITSGYTARESTLALRGFLMNAHQVPSSAQTIQWVTAKGFAMTFLACAALLAIVVVAALAGCLVQHKPTWTFEPMSPKLSKLSPMQGFKRIFGKEALANFVKGMVKIGVVGAVLAVTLWAEHDRVESFVTMDLNALLPATLSILLKMMIGVVVIYFFVGVGDYAYMRFTWMQRQRMTREEMKQEYKDTEGNPEIKAKVRQIRTQRLRKRMMASVPTATVVITNPTHYAVALRYESGMEAPICVAKGVDTIALKIREVAGEHGVPIVENPPLARALHATIDIDDPVPVEHYKAVAEVIGFVLRGRRRRA